MVGFCGGGVLFLVTCMVLVIEYSCVEYSCDSAFTVRNSVSVRYLVFDMEAYKMLSFGMEDLILACAISK